MMVNSHTILIGWLYNHDLILCRICWSSPTCKHCWKGRSQDRRRWHAAIRSAQCSLRWQSFANPWGCKPATCHPAGFCDHLWMFSGGFCFSKFNQTIWMISSWPRFLFLKDCGISNNPGDKDFSLPEILGLWPPDDQLWMVFWYLNFSTQTWGPCACANYF